MDFDQTNSVNFSLVAQEIDYSIEIDGDCEEFIRNKGITEIIFDVEIIEEGCAQIQNPILKTTNTATNNSNRINTV